MNGQQVIIKRRGRNGCPSASPARSVTVAAENQKPTATAQSVITSDSTGQVSVTLQGADLETPAAELVYTITSLPSSGTLFLADHSAVAVGNTFVGSAAVFTYLLPIKVFGNFSTLFTFTVTDTGAPAGQVSNALTSSPAAVMIQTPANSAGILRIRGTLAGDTISLTKNASKTALHVVEDGAAIGNDVPLSLIKSIRIVGRGANDEFTVVAGLGAPISVLGGAGNDTLTAGATNLTFDGGGGNDVGSLTTSSGKDTATLRPRSATVKGTGYVLSLTNVPTIKVRGDAQDTATLYDSVRNNAFIATPLTATISGPAFTSTVAGFGNVNAVAGAGGIDTADLTGSKGLDNFTATPHYGLLTGPGYSLRATGFAAVTAHAKPGGSDTANLFDSSGNDTFTGQPAYSLLSGAHYANKAVGFATVNATASTGKDQANLTDAALAGAFTGSGNHGTLSGPGYTINLTKFAAVTLDGRKSKKNTIHVSALGYALQKLGTWLAQ